MVMIENGKLLPKFLCGPQHGKPVDPIIEELKPMIIAIGWDADTGPVMYCLNFWNIAPGSGFFYYAHQDADIEDILDAVCQELDA